MPRQRVLTVSPLRERYPVLVSPSLPTLPDDADAALPVSLDAFLAGIGPRAFRFAEAGLRQRDDALDAVQDAMLRMLAYREKPAGEWSPLFWSILRRRVVDLQRRRSFRLRFWRSSDEAGAEHDIDWADPGPGPAQAHEQRDQYAALVKALRELPARQREAFSLRVLQQLDGATTAAAMGCSEGAVKTHLSRARQALQQHLEIEL
ncbi:RNA polymerase sigma factor [Stenotrophomonas bentonitica]|uniref:RNA polymerase sigma factor n=1 Tax=Stenotrophomonas bentonitica TaxID=1450134 RepID=UPI00345ED816